MLIQRIRMEAFRRHIHAVVQPGDTVLEIGTGLGTYSYFAVEAGAGKVYAVEGGPILSVTKAVARANDLQEKVEFVRGWFPDVHVPAPIDVLIFEDYPPRLLDAATVDVLRHARQLLSPQGRMIPERARLFLAPTRCQQAWEVIGPLGKVDDRAYGINWEPSREYIYNKPLQMPVEEDDLLLEPKMIGEVNLGDLVAAPQLGGEATWMIEADCEVHGLTYWFEFDVGDTWLSNGPGREPRSWGNLFLPFAEPVMARAGRTMTARVAIEGGADGVPGWFTWSTESDDQQRRGHEFKSFPASLDELVPSTPSWIPELSDSGALELNVMALADGSRSVNQIADELCKTNPGWKHRDALAFAMRALSGRTVQKPRAATT